MTLAEQYMQAGMEKEAARTPALDSAASSLRQRAMSKLTQAGMQARAHPVATGLGAAALGGGAFALKKLMARKSMGQRLVGAMKKNRGALIGGGAAAGGLAGLAAYRKSQSK